MTESLKRREHAIRLAHYLMSVAFGLLFLAAGGVKAIDPILFLENVRSFEILPDPWAAWLAMGLPWFEIAVGLGLVSRVFYPGSLIGGMGALMVFLGAIGSAWIRGLDVQCGCFGETGEVTDYGSIMLRNLFLIGLGAFLAWSYGMVKRPPLGEDGGAGG